MIHLTTAWRECTNETCFVCYCCIRATSLRKLNAFSRKLACFRFFMWAFVRDFAEQMNVSPSSNVTW
jgi:hypothetical protein